MAEVELVPRGGRPSGSAAPLHAASNNEEVLKQLAPLRSERVIRLSAAEGAFSGWVSEAEQARLFTTMTEYFLLGGSWCCSSRDKDEGRVYYRKPPVLRLPLP